MEFKKTDDATVLCVNCHKNKHQAGTEMLIVGDGIGICLKCLNLGAWIGNNLGKRRFRETEEGKNLLAPKEIKSHLDDYVIGQHVAKKVISVAVYEHYKRISQEKNPNIELEKSNILMIGSTGVGKTYIGETLSRILKVPFAVVDASGLTEAGYVGGNIDDLLMPLIVNGDYDVEKIERGILLIDEIDKIRKKSSSANRDISGSGAQQQLLKFLEGKDITVSYGAGHNKKEITINTKNILFICAGSFAEIEDQIQRKNCKKNPMGFKSDVKSKDKLRSDEIIQNIDKQDLLDFGMIPEIMGRLPVIAKLNDLDVEDLIRILTEPKNSITDQKKWSFELEGVELKFEQKALKAIAEQAILHKAGARGLRGIVEEMIIDIMFEIPSNPDITEFTVTKEMVTGEGEELKTLSI